MSSEKAIKEISPNEQFHLEKRKILWLLGLKEDKKNKKILMEFYRQLRFNVAAKSGNQL